MIPEPDRHLMEPTMEDRIREILLKARDLEQEAEGSRNEAR